MDRAIKCNFNHYKYSSVKLWCLAAKNNKWFYENNQIYEKSTWKLIPDETGDAGGGAWYYFDENSYMATGWQLIAGNGIS